MKNGSPVLTATTGYWLSTVARSADDGALDIAGLQDKVGVEV